MAATHLLIETGRASRTAACTEPFANGQPGSENMADVTCTACREMFGCHGPRFDDGEEAQSYAALCRAKAPVVMFAVPHGDHWHIRGMA
jgi:hypothetical protein